METNQLPTSPPSRFTDAYKSGVGFLIGMVASLLMFRRNLPLETATMFFAAIGCFFAMKALLRGPLSLLGGVFLVLNGWMLVGVVMVWIEAL